MIKPMPEYIVLGEPVVLNKTVGGLLLPDEIIKNQATVLAVGSKVTWCKVGDQVLYREYAGDKIEHDGKKYLVILEKELRGIVSEN